MNLGTQHFELIGTLFFCAHSHFKNLFSLYNKKICSSKTFFRRVDQWVCCCTHKILRMNFSQVEMCVAFLSRGLSSCGRISMAVGCEHNTHPTPQTLQGKLLECFVIYFSINAGINCQRASVRMNLLWFVFMCTSFLQCNWSGN